MLKKELEAHKSLKNYLECTFNLPAGLLLPDEQQLIDDVTGHSEATHDTSQRFLVYVHRSQHFTPCVNVGGVNFTCFKYTVS